MAVDSGCAFRAAGLSISITAPSTIETAPPDAQDAVRGKLRFQHEQRERQQQQRRAQPVDGQHRERRKPQQHQDRSHDARHDQARRSELHVNAQRAEHQQNQRDVGIGDGGDDFLRASVFS